MRSEKITVISDIAQLMIDLQMKHDIPVNIIVGDSVTDYNNVEQQILVCEYEDEDYHAYVWLFDKATYLYQTKRIYGEN